MEIKLLCPINDITVSLTPKIHSEIMESLPKDDKIINSDYDWFSPTAQGKDCSKPANVMFSWALEGSLAQVTDIYLFLATSPDFEGAEKIEIYPGQMFLSLNNFVHDRYYWKMLAMSDGAVLYETAPQSFNVDTDSIRWFDIKGATNVRDIGNIKLNGNLRLKSRMIYRGSELDGMVTAGKSGLKYLSHSIKIKTDLDLRRADDIDKNGISPIKNANLINIPIRAYADIFTGSEREKYAKIFKVLANPDSYPVYMHCIAGADRTGTVIYILLCLLGADTDTADYEYELTSASVFGMRSRYNAYFAEFKREFGQYGATPQLRAENYLFSCGVTREEMQAIKDILTQGVN